MITIIASTFKHFSLAGRLRLFPTQRKVVPDPIIYESFTKSHWGFAFHSMSVFFVSYIGLNGDRIPHDDDDDLMSSGTI